MFPPSDPSKKRSNRGRWVVLSVLGIGLFALVLVATGVDRLADVAVADWDWVIAAVGAGVGVTIVSTFRWGYITNSLIEEKALSWFQYWSALMTSRVVGLFIPRSASDLGVRFVALVGSKRTSAAVATASVALDQLFDLALLVTLIAPSILILSGGNSLWLLAVYVVAAAIGVLLMFRLSAGITWFARRLEVLARRLGQKRGKVGEFFYRQASRLEQLANVRRFGPGQSATIAAATVCRYVLNSVMFWSISQGLGLQLSLWTFILVGAGVQLSLVAAVTPGGLGIMDLGWAGLLALGGVVGENIGVFLIGQRAFQYSFFVGMALISYLGVWARTRASRINAKEELGA